MKGFSLKWTKIELYESPYFKRLGHSSKLYGNKLIVFGGEIESQVIKYIKKICNLKLSFDSFSITLWNTIYLQENPSCCGEKKTR